jgi:hypothetical protein
MGIRMVIELSDHGSVPTAVQALEAYRVRLCASITLAKRRLATFEARYAADTRHFLHDLRELSAVARACVLNSGDPPVTGILQSA